MTTDELMSFMINFEQSMENTMNGIGNEINKKIDDNNKKIDDKLTTLDLGLGNLAIEVRKNDTKHDNNFKDLENKLENRLKKLEIDAGRQKFGRMKRNSGNLNQDGGDPQSTRMEGERGTRSKDPNFQPTGSSHPVDPLLLSPRLQRQSSWAEEVERTIGDSVETDRTRADRNQWVDGRRTPSDWAEGLNREVRGAAELAGRPNMMREEQERKRQSRSSREPRKVHECKTAKVTRIHHWFGESSGEESSEESGEENWTRVDRETKNKMKRKKLIARDNKKKEEITLKVRRMAGLGPITEEDIDLQRQRTGSYETAKTWAVKDHLARHYRYNNEELDTLEILETKRAAKGDIIYIAVAK